MEVTSKCITYDKNRHGDDRGGRLVSVTTIHRQSYFSTIRSDQMDLKSYWTGKETRQPNFKVWLGNADEERWEWPEVGRSEMVVLVIQLIKTRCMRKNRDESARCSLAALFEISLWPWEQPISFERSHISYLMGGLSHMLKNHETRYFASRNHREAWMCRRGGSGRKKVSPSALWRP